MEGRSRSRTRSAVQGSFRQHGNARGSGPKVSCPETCSDAYSPALMQPGPPSRRLSPVTRRQWTKRARRLVVGSTTSATGRVVVAGTCSHHHHRRRRRSAKPRFQQRDPDATVMPPPRQSTVTGSQLLRSSYGRIYNAPTLLEHSQSIIGEHVLLVREYASANLSPLFLLHLLMCPRTRHVRRGVRWTNQVGAITHLLIGQLHVWRSLSLPDKYGDNYRAQCVYFLQRGSRHDPDEYNGLHSGGHR